MYSGGGGGGQESQNLQPPVPLHCTRRSKKKRKQDGAHIELVLPLVTMVANRRRSLKRNQKHAPTDHAKSYVS